MDFGLPKNFPRKLPLSFAFGEKVAWNWALVCDDLTGAPLDEACLKHDQFSSAPWISVRERVHGSLTDFHGSLLPRIFCCTQLIPLTRCEQTIALSALVCCGRAVVGTGPRSGAQWS
jgi:hypothetical protein